MYDFGVLLKQLRQERGYTQVQLAKKLNKSKSSICKYESNEKFPTLETMIDISILFNVSLDYLAGIEKGKSFQINDLTHSQVDIINTLLVEFRTAKKYTTVGLTQRQLQIINEIIVEFFHS